MSILDFHPNELNGNYQIQYKNLKNLENKWFFYQIGQNSEIEFHIDFELKNKILNMLMIKSFDFGLKKIAESFEKRAIKLFKKT